MNAHAPAPAQPSLSRPLLRWHGGKWLMAPWIIGHFPRHRVYVEPFGGAASVLLRKPRAQAEVWNDLDDDLVNLFRVLRSPSAGELLDKLRLTPFARREFEDAYDRTDDSVERARRTVIRSYMGFGSGSVHMRSGFRSNGLRAGTLPQHNWTSYPDALAAIVERLAGVVIEHKDACDLIRRHDRPDCLFYADPPYLPSTRNPGHDYAHEMSDEQHEALLDLLQRVDGMVVLSGYPSPLYDDRLAGWQRVETPAYADGARARTEVLWLNPACAQALRVGERQRNLDLDEAGGGL